MYGAACARTAARSGEGDWSPAIACGEQAELTETGDARLAALLRLALAPTARPADDDGPLASTGLWKIDVRAAGVRSDDSLRMNGTSVAAPVFARRLYNWLMTGGNAVGAGGWQAAIDGVVAAQAASDDLVRHAHPDERDRFKPEQP